MLFAIKLCKMYVPHISLREEICFKLEPTNVIIIENSVCSMALHPPHPTIPLCGVWSQSDGFVLPERMYQGMNWRSFYLVLYSIALRTVLLSPVSMPRSQ